jgi:benzodiazapine receptor
MNFLRVFTSLLPLIISNLINFAFAPKYSTPQVSFQPPGYVFGVVWTIIYVLFGIYVVRLFDTIPPFFYSLLVVSIMNFVINLTWTPMVFVRKNNIYGLYSIFFMIFTLLAMMIMLENDVTSKLLLLPYLSWLLVAMSLQIEVIRSLKQKKVTFQV